MFFFLLYRPLRLRRASHAPPPITPDADQHAAPPSNCPPFILESGRYVRTPGVSLGLQVPKPAGSGRLVHFPTPKASEHSRTQSGGPPFPHTVEFVLHWAPIAASPASGVHGARRCRVSHPSFSSRNMVPRELLARTTDKLSPPCSAIGPESGVLRGGVSSTTRLDPT